MIENQQPEQEQPTPGEESTGHAGLDKILSEGAVDFDKGIDTAQVWVSAFLIVLLGVLLYAGALGAPFQGEDSTLVHSNPAMHQVTTAVNALDAQPEAPLALLGLALNWRLTPDSPFGFHLAALLLHIANGLLLYLLVRRLLPRGVPEIVAVAAGLLLVAHPLATHTVLYLPGRAALQAVFFALAALNLYVLATPSADQWRPGTLMAALGCYLLAAGSHLATMALPVLVLWVDVIRFGVPVLARRAAIHGGALLALLLMLMLRAAAPHAEGTAYPESFLEAGNTLAAFVSSALRALVTGGPAAPIPADAASIAVGVLGAGIVLLLLLAALILLGVRSVAGLAPLWLLVMGCAVGCLLPLDNALAAHWFYLVLPGAVLLVPWCISLFRTPAVRTALGIGAAALVLIAALGTYQRNVQWTEPTRLWPAAAQAHPEDQRPWRYLAEHAENRAQRAPDAETAREHLASAAGYWEEAHARAANDAEIRKHLGHALLQIGQVPQAINHLDAARRALPFDGEAAAYAARVYDLRLRTRILERMDGLVDALGWPGELANNLASALMGAPPDGNAARVLVRLYRHALKDAPTVKAARAAIDRFARADTLDALTDRDRLAYALLLAGLDNVQDAHAALAGIRGQPWKAPAEALSRQFEDPLQQAKAREQESESLLADPAKAVDALQHRAESLLLRGRFLQAAYFLEAIIGRAADNAAAWTLLGVVRAELGQTDSFLAAHGDSPAATRDNVNDLATRCAGRGNWTAAEQYLAQKHGTENFALQRALAEVAGALGQTARAEQILREAARADAQAPEPWLGLADLALAEGQPEAAAWFLAEAQERGAAGTSLEERRKQLEAAGVAPVDPDDTTEEEVPARTIIR
ncbi:MAG: hypothetical protein ACLFTT_05535 [Candidatus Hydrogenedentota bacterium]